MSDADLIRFINAQAPVYRQVVEELTGRDRRTHWIRFIFPQLAGLGRGATAQRYAIRDLDQATRYLADPILGNCLRQDVRLMTGHEGKSALQILGSLHNLKFQSCTLFDHAAVDQETPDERAGAIRADNEHDRQINASRFSIGQC